MKTYRYDVKAFATIEVTAKNERQASEALHGWSIDVNDRDELPNGVVLVCTQVTADDGEPELMEDYG